MAGFWTLTTERAEQRDALAAAGVDLAVDLTRKAAAHILDAAKKIPIGLWTAADLEVGGEIPPRL